ncbi:4'-phosphopantetheinyl transferase family protein [Neisseria sp. CCUG17229]|uniref:4'-phosphopantetheinyl transferase family protein n=1 Tax=Neisseria sp. CCUG17229 TaxID=3392036 RepID=UPI003A1030F5
MTTPNLICLLADSELTKHYSDDLLNETDTLRLAQSPTLSQRLDWQVSRALKFQTASSIQSLSHSHGHAALLTADTVMPIGVDIEKIKPRAYKVLAECVYSQEEQSYLAQMGWPIEEFYRLWCLKEALIKATGFNFPADMARVGYAFQQGRISGLYVEGQSSWHGISALLKREFALACVWQGEAQTEIHWQFYGDLLTEDLANEKAV